MNRCLPAIVLVLGGCDFRVEGGVVRDGSINDARDGGFDTRTNDNTCS